MRIRALVVIASIDVVIILLGILFVAIEPAADISKTIAITIGSMLALTLGVVWGEAKAGYIAKLREHTVPVFIAFVLTALYTATLADGADVVGAFKTLLLSILSLGSGVLAFIFITGPLEKGLEQAKAPEWMQAVVPAFVGLVVFGGVAFGVILLLSYFI